MISYNIFARSLGSNCIPWVMTVSREWEKRIEVVTGKSWGLFVKDCLLPEYKTHFHKNYTSGNKVEMRQLWSMRVNGPHDIPTSLGGLSYVDENCLEYFDGKGEAGAMRRATTLPGVLQMHLPVPLHNELYDHIMSVEQQFQWNRRGPRIFEEITKIRADFDLRPSPEIVSLCEYDVHEVSAVYRKRCKGNCAPLKEESFAEAMAEVGYAGILMRSPDEHDNSGLGVFWKKSAFKLERGEELKENSIMLLPGEDLCNSAFNYDLHEGYHRLLRDQPDKSCYETLPTSERKHISCVRLIHKETGKLLLVVSLHLTTATKDSTHSEYEGEIRACQLHKISRIIATHLNGSYSKDSTHNTQAIDGILVMGDFNMDVKAKNIFTGDLTSQISSKTISIETGLIGACHPEHQFPDLHWRISPAYPCPGPLNRRNFLMYETFSGVHQWGRSFKEEIGAVQHCTSYSSSRCEWIDLLWYSPCHLRPVHITHPAAFEPSSGPMPNSCHPSDHIPISAVFEFVN